ncbi:hypothetical protein GSI_08516 [Ganoderma sinense ZZ0214-1]|uniref:Uncharacterized protein n=1 Tax=Ganoderma sinense ZZ0214-1 TaxID=1077348 RepID=A0A2G8S4I8_9APHY|nr:hypothetical protein GSI_08516 [Ganoderma sinense ZZ0214-1]
MTPRKLLLSLLLGARSDIVMYPLHTIFVFYLLVMAGSVVNKMNGMTNVFKVGNGREMHVYRTGIAAKKNSLLSQFSYAAEDLAAKKQEEREAELQWWKSVWVDGRTNVTLHPLVSGCSLSVICTCDGGWSYACTLITMKRLTRSAKEPDASSLLGRLRKGTRSLSRPAGMLGPSVPELHAWSGLVEEGRACSWWMLLKCAPRGEDFRPPNMARRYTETARLSGGHDAEGITCVGFSTDGTLLGTGGMDGSLCIWNAENGKLLHKYVTISAIPITSLGWIKTDRLSVMIGNKDGNLIVVVINKIPTALITSRGPDNTYELVALIEQPALESSEGKEVLVTGVQWIPSDKYGQLLLAAYMFHGVQLVETTTWTRAGAVPIEGKIASASVSEDGTCVAVSNLTTGFDIYLLDSGKLLHTFEHDVGERLPTPVLFIHNGQAVVGGSTVGRVNMWDLDRGKMPTLSIPNRGRVLAIAAHDTGEVGGYHLRLATATFPRQVPVAEPAHKPSAVTHESTGKLTTTAPPSSPASSLWVTFGLVVCLTLALLAPGFFARWEES